MKAILCKDHKLTIIIILMLFFLGGCNSPAGDAGDGKIASRQKAENNQNLSNSAGDLGDGRITKVNLTDREQSLLQAAGVQKSFIFEVDLQNKKFELISCWVDYYEKGQFKKKIYELTSSPVGLALKSNTLVFLAFDSEPDSPYQTWGISCGNGSAKVKLDKPESDAATSWQAASTCIIKKGEDLNLAYIAEGKTDGQGGSMVSSPDILDKESMKELLSNQKVYIIRCRFE